MRTIEKPKLSEPFNAKKLMTLRRWAGIVLATSMLSVFVLSLLPDIVDLSEATSKALSEGSIVSMIPALFSGAFLFYTTAWDIQPLTGKKLAELAKASVLDNELLAYAQKIKAQERDPVMEDLKAIRRYQQQKEAYQEHQTAADAWKALQT